MTIEKPCGRNSRQRVWFFLFSGLVAAGIFAYLFSMVSPGEIVDVLRGINFRWVLLFLLFSFSMSLFRTWRYKLVLNASGNYPDGIALYLITLVRNFFSDLLPARLGTLVYIYLVQTRLGIAFGPAASSFAYAFLFDMVSLAPLIILAVIVQTSGFISTPTVIAGGVLLGSASIGVLAVLPFMLRVTANKCLALPVISRRLRQRMHNALKDTEKNMVLAKQQNIYWRIFALSLGVRICKYLSLYVLLIALVLPLGHTLQSFSLPKVFLGLCSAELAASLPLSGIAGFGLYDGAWALVFQLLGYSERIAILTGISHHLLTQVYGYTLGALALLVLLLPVFKRDRVDSPGKQVVAGGLFWLKFTAVAALILLCFFFLFPGRDKATAVDRLDMKKSVLPAADLETTNYGEKIQGKIVYQRPDGIYSLSLPNRKSTRIIPYGSYPRWSPDGKHIVFVHADAIMLADDNGKNVVKIVSADRARAVGFTSGGKAILFSDGKYLKKVDLGTGKVTVLLENNEFREFDISNNGMRLAATVRTPFGVKVRVFNLGNGVVRTVGNGCSASLSPDGQLITVNNKSHTKLFFHQWESLQRTGFIGAPKGLKFDNQFWSNHPEWVVSTSEGITHDIYMHYVPSNTSFRVTSTGDCDRADLFVTEFER